MGGEICVVAPDGVPEVTVGDDLVAMLLPLVELADGDVVVVTSKVVSKAEGRVREATTRDAELAAETVRVVARRGPTSIVRTRHGLIMAAAGIDASNVAMGSVVLLPEDPDASARRLRSDIAVRTGHNVGVVVTDTAGRAWREGQTDIAVGAAGLLVLDDHAGRTDAHGNALVVTAPALADEIASMAELAQGKLTGRPFAVVRGRADLVLAPDDEGAGARALVRRESGDLFGYGAREAVVRALAGVVTDQPPFGAPVAAEELRAVLCRTGLTADLVTGGLTLPGPVADGDRVRVAALAYAHGWQVGPDTGSGVAVGLHPTPL